MRWFDAAGAIVVVSWVGLLGAYVLKHERASAPIAVSASGQVSLSAGDSWMIVLRDGEDVGYIHEARTALDEGWLLEYDMLTVVDLMGRRQWLQSSVKAAVDPQGGLRTFSADSQSLMVTMSVQGEVRDGQLVMSTQLGDAKREHKAAYKPEQGLAQDALRHILASPALKPGAVFERERFDPLSMGMSTLRYTYRGRETLELYGQKHQTHLFWREVMGTTLSVYVNDAGEVLTQQLPLNTMAVWMPPELARARAASLRRQARKEADKVLKLPRPEALERSDAALDVASAMILIDQQQMSRVGEALARAFVRLSGVPDDASVSLESARQRLVDAPGEPGERVLALEPRDDAGLTPWTEPGLDDALRARLLAADLRVDAQHEALAPLTDGLDTITFDDVRARTIAARVHERMRPVPDVGITSASEALTRGSGDCTEYTLVLVAALRRAKIPARFVLGALVREGQLAPHTWAQYWDGERFMDLDATLEKLDLGPTHVQLMTSETPDPAGFVHLIGALRLRPVTPPSPPKELAP